MSDSGLDLARSLFDRALVVPGPERAAFVRREAGGNSELAEMVLALLAEHDGAVSFGAPPGGVDGITTPAPSTIGAFRILGVLGEGGMGVVYEAEQSRPQRHVALKVVRPGLASAQALRRFEHEAEILARLQHPGIAQVYEAGTATTALGPSPYFAMELVKGVSLTKYVEEHHLGTRDRLALVVKVCEAVQHAHQKGVIHRDLKPGNILVDATGQPKVLDFGVARLTDSDIQTTTMRTDIGQLIGTVPYMSPEQASGQADDLDTRSDVYALGVIAYELLAGRLPYDVRQKLVHEAVRVIREGDPTPLSSVNKVFRGDVETIVGKALEKDKTRRYQSAGDLAADIGRYLHDEPIVARPAGTWYQTVKFARRNKGLVFGVGAAFVALSAGLAVSLWQRSEAITSQRAEAKQREEAVKQRARANERADAAEKAEAAATAARDAEKQRADELKKVSEFQSHMLGQIDTKAAGEGLIADVRERFVAALEKAGVPEVERGALAKTLGDLLIRINATDTAAAMIDRTILKPAIKTIDQQFKNDPATDASLRQALADLYETIGLYDAAFPLQETALEKRRRVLGEEHPDTLVSINNMGLLLRAQGKLAEAEPHYREALEKRRRVLGEEHPATLISINNMGFLLRFQGKLSEAEPYLREALEKSRRVLGEEHPATLTSINNMGLLLQNQGKLAEAEPYYREALEKRRRVLGEEHLETLRSINNMGSMLHDLGKLAEAEPYYREALEKSRRVLGEEHPHTLISINDLGLLLQDQGKLAEAEPYHREALEKSRRVLGEEHPNTLTSINNMGLLLQDQGKLAEAEPYYREALEKSRRVLGEEHPDTLISIDNMGLLLQDQGKLAEAEPYLREALEKSRRVLGEEHPDTLVSIINMGSLLKDQGKRQEAIDLLAPAEAAARKQFTGASAPRLADFLTTFGRARAGVDFDAERFQVAESNLLEAHAIYLAAKDRYPTHKDTLGCVQALVDLYTAWDKAEPGKGYDAKAAEWKLRLETAEPPKAAGTPSQKNK